jgi:hypothetical protein
MVGRKLNAKVDGESGQLQENSSTPSCKSNAELVNINSLNAF